MPKKILKNNYFKFLIKILKLLNFQNCCLVKLFLINIHHSLYLSDNTVIIAKIFEIITVLAILNSFFHTLQFFFNYSKLQFSYCC